MTTRDGKSEWCGPEAQCPACGVMVRNALAPTLCEDCESDPKNPCCIVKGCNEPASLKHRMSGRAYCADHAADQDETPCMFFDLHYPDEPSDCDCDSCAPTIRAIAANKGDDDYGYREGK